MMNLTGSMNSMGVTTQGPLTDVLLSSTRNVQGTCNNSRLNMTSHPLLDKIIKENQTSMPAQGSEVHSLLFWAHTLYVYVYPVIFLIGIVNNTLVCILVRRDNLKNVPVTVYLGALAISDSVVLICDLIDNWSERAFRVFLIGSSTAVCRIYHYVFSSSYIFSAWLVVCIAVQRVIVVCLPFRAKSLCNIRLSKISTAVVFFVVWSVEIYHLIVWRVDENAICHFNPRFQYFLQNVQMWLQSVLYSYVPCMVLICCNVILVYRLSRARMQRKTMMQGSKSAKDRNTDQLTYTAVAICVSFLVCTAPVSIFYTIAFATENFNYVSPGYALAGTIINMIGLCNYVVNLFLYILTSHTFANELKQVLCFWKKSNDSLSNNQRVQTGTSSVPN